MSKKNEIILQGILEDCSPITSINDVPFDGYIFFVSTVRTSGTVDEAVVITDKTFDMLGIKLKHPIRIEGEVQIIKNFKTHHSIVCVYAYDVLPVQEKNWEYINHVYLQGVLGKTNVFRRTPYGKDIADINVCTETCLRKSGRYIPTICWNKTARMVRHWEAGHGIIVEGYLQRRRYNKTHDDGRIEEKTVYEVSAYKVVDPDWGDIEDDT